MPSHVGQALSREDSNPSESERSFVSAGSENTSSKSKKESRIGQSAVDASAPSSPRRLEKTFAPTNFTPSPTHTKTTSDTSSLTKRIQVLSPSPPRRLTAPLSLPVGSYFAQQPGASGLEPRSPQNRRPPASRSSHGIETASGPPPALSTQRSYTESPWRSAPAIEPRAIHPPLTQQPTACNSIDSVVKLAQKPSNDDPGSAPTKPAQVARSRPSTSDGIMTSMETRIHGRWGSGEDKDSTLRINGQYTHARHYARDTDAQEQSQSLQDDLFLNLAREDSVVDDGAEPLSRSERRRSRIGLSSFSQARTSRPSSSGRPSTSGASFGGYQASPNQHSNESSFDSSSHRSPEKGSLASLRDSLSRNRPYAASAHPLDQRNRTRNTRTSFGGATRDVSIDERAPETPMPYGRRKSIRDTSPGVGSRNYKQSNLSYATNGDYGSSPIQSSPAYAQEATKEISQAANTESTISTTAPSTVWDELDDLKSRLRKIELTGILPKSSNAAMSNALSERPPTATTTITTISSSPKRRQPDSVSPEASTIKSPGNANLHPLLHSALAKAKPMVKSNLYRALEATASDALSLAAMTGSAGSQGASSSPAAVVGPASGIDRQLRRKADNMCRSLTELCIALAEEMPEVENYKDRPGSKDTISTELALPNPRLLRGASDEPELRSSSRVMSRLEARRTSLLGSSPLYGRRGSPQEATTPTQATTPVSSRLDRTSSVLLRNRSNEDEGETVTSRRPPSRAATEIGQTRPSPQTRMSREYTSQHPMPSQPQRSPSIQSTLPTRKSHFSPASQSPLTPTVQPGHRRYLDRSTPPSSADSSRLAEARQRRIASLGQGQSRIGVSSGRLRQTESEQQR